MSVRTDSLSIGRSRSQLLEKDKGEGARFSLTRTTPQVHPSEIDLSEEEHPFYPGSEGLVRMASRLVDMGYRLVEMDVRDDAARRDPSPPRLVPIMFSRVHPTTGFQIE